MFVINGSSIGAKRLTNGREIRRDTSKFKVANTLMKEEEDYGPPARQARGGGR